MESLFGKKVLLPDENQMLSWVKSASAAELAAAAFFSLYEYAAWSSRIRKTRQDCLELGNSCLASSAIENDLLPASEFDRPRPENTASRA